MEIIFKAKHWQIFILIIGGLMIGNLSIQHSPMFTAICKIVGMMVFMIYPFTIGHLLQVYLPKTIRLNHKLFLINSFIWLVAFSVVMIISDGNGMTFNGIEAIPFLYIAFAFLHFIAFPAKTLKSIEANREVEFKEYIGYFFLIVFLPIGIWILQPRVMKIIKKKDV